MILTLTQKERIAQDVIRFRLAGKDILPFESGAHIILHTPFGAKKYSLISSSKETSFYDIAVLKISSGQGGSTWLHEEFVIGDTINVEGPFLGFELGKGSGPHLLLAGGIGVTPIYSFLKNLSEKESAFEVHYGYRSEERKALGREIEQLSKGGAHFYNAELNQNMNFDAIISDYTEGAHVYVCGPRGMIEAVKNTAKKKMWPSSAIHFESFGAGALQTQIPSTLKLVLSEQEVTLDPKESVLDALEKAGAWVSYECKRGECGKCVVEYSEGEVEHRDVCLTDSARTTMMCPCVSVPRTSSIKLSI